MLSLVYWSRFTGTWHTCYGHSGEVWVGESSDVPVKASAVLVADLDIRNGGCRGGVSYLMLSAVSGAGWKSAVYFVLILGSSV